MVKKFGTQAVYLFGSLSIIVLLIYFNTVGKEFVLLLTISAKFV